MLAHSMTNIQKYPEKDKSDMKEEIIKLARQAGFAFCEESYKHQPNCLFHGGYAVDALLERFASLVVAAERKKCAAIARQWDVNHPTSNYGGCIANLIELREQVKDEMPLFDDWGKKW